MINTPTIWEMNFFGSLFRFPHGVSSRQICQDVSIAAFWLEILKRKFRKSMTKAFSKTALNLAVRQSFQQLVSVKMVGF